MLRFGPATGPVVIAAMPLFEEANRTRAVIVTVLRALAERGIAGILADLPGTGDSIVPTHAATIAQMRDAYAAVVKSIKLEERPAFAFGIRSAALLDTWTSLSGRYHLVPQQGEQLLRELKRIRYAGLDRKAPEGDAWMSAENDGAPIEIAGNLLSADLLRELADSPQVDEFRRVARLETDAQPADIKFAAAPLWRRAEPDNDPALAALVAEDIAEWIARCGG